jgi:hypothetical protein
MVKISHLHRLFFSIANTGIHRKEYSLLTTEPTIALQKNISKLQCRFSTITLQTLEYKIILFRSKSKCSVVDTHWITFIESCGFCDVPFRAIAKVETLDEDIRSVKPRGHKLNLVWGPHMRKLKAEEPNKSHLKTLTVTLY